MNSHITIMSNKSSTAEPGKSNERLVRLATNSYVSVVDRAAVPGRYTESDFGSRNSSPTFA